MLGKPYYKKIINCHNVVIYFSTNEPDMTLNTNHFGFRINRLVWDIWNNFNMIEYFGNMVLESYTALCTEYKRKL